MVDGITLTESGGVLSFDASLEQTRTKLCIGRTVRSRACQQETWRWLVRVGDLVQTIKGWSYKTWTGVILELQDTNGELYARVLWTEASQIDGQVFWAPARKLDVINEVIDACG